MRHSLIQRTVAQDVECQGIGLHSGQPVCMTLRPADPHTGIYFVRTDCPPEHSVIPARWTSVVKTELCTVLGNDHGIQVSTVEHIMAALAGMGITNAIIEIDGPEVPALDGSASPFMDLIAEAGVEAQPGALSVIQVLEPISVSEGKSWMTLEPSETFSIDLVFDFGLRSVGLPSQTLHLQGDYGSIMKQVGQARTVGFFEDYEFLKSRGFARGGTLDNAVVYHTDTVMNPEGLRYHDECVRHKILDALGDFYLLGAPLRGALKGHCSGHALNTRMMRQLMNTPTAWRMISVKENLYPVLQLTSRTFEPSLHQIPVFCF